MTESCWNCQWDELPAIEKEVPKFHDLKCAVSFVEKQRQQLTQREAEVAALRDAAEDYHSCRYSDNEFEGMHLANVLKDTAQVAEAFKVKVWNEAISTAIETITLPLDHQFLFSGEVHNANDIAKIRTLLKPESEVV